jgi:hypothetical protein
MCCEERERLTRVYLDMAENRRKVLDSIQHIHSAEWICATKETSVLCKAALAAIKAHRKEHGC